MVIIQSIMPRKETSIKTPEQQDLGFREVLGWWCFLRGEESSTVPTTSLTPNTPPYESLPFGCS